VRQALLIVRDKLGPWLHGKNLVVAVLVGLIVLVLAGDDSILQAILGLPAADDPLAQKVITLVVALLSAFGIQKGTPPTKEPPGA